MDLNISIADLNNPGLDTEHPSKDLCTGLGRDVLLRKRQPQGVVPDRVAASSWTPLVVN